jgi:hypothetical protein
MPGGGTPEMFMKCIGVPLPYVMPPIEPVKYYLSFVCLFLYSLTWQSGAVTYTAACKAAAIVL